jgi:hypothetical protein
VPLPPASLHVTPYRLEAGSTWHRVHANRHAPTAFNPGKGNARFSPISASDGTPVPTIYAADSFEGAVMESVFHDIPYHPGTDTIKSVSEEKLTDQVHSRITVSHDLTLADLAAKSLRKLGVARRHLIECDKDQYPATRKWAEAIHAQHPEIQGLSWVSRQDDTSRAVVLFADRVPTGALRQLGSCRSLRTDINAFTEVLKLADHIGAVVIPADM